MHPAGTALQLRLVARLDGKWNRTDVAASYGALGCSAFREPNMRNRPNSKQRAIQRESGENVRQLLTEFTEEHARMLELRLTGLTGPEIAEVMDRNATHHPGSISRNDR